MADPIVQVEHLFYRYPTRDQFALTDINLTIQRGEFVAIIGQNGSGKTTLIKHFNGLLKPTEGRVVVDGHVTTELPTSELAKFVGFVFQNPDHQIFAETIQDEVTFGPKNLGFPPERIQADALRVLEQMNLSGCEEEMPFQLSRGQRQRLAVASVLAMEPSVLIIDEPTTGQDWKESMALMNLVLELNRNGHTCIVTTHNMNLVSLFAKRVIVMRSAKVFMDGPTQEIFRNVSELEKAWIKPPVVYALTQALIPEAQLEKPITPNDLAELLVARAERSL
ncbi:MAG: ABC transporter ATP-binding protein [Chloroflexi bacterium]|nr:ABC transporter ATP-binding protein [Chloroflexota bacterium]